MAKKNETIQFVVKSAVKDYISQHDDMRTSGELADALNEKVEQLLDAAIKRCSENGRKTIQPQDL